MPATAAGTSYTVRSASVSGAGTVYWTIGDDASALPSRPIVLYMHGAGGAANQFATLAAWAALRDWLIDNGWGVIEGTGGGLQPWGNPSSQSAYDAAFDYVDQILDIAKVVVLGRSMGGAVGARVYNAHRTTDPRFVGYISNSGVQDLVWAYDWDGGRWTAAFNAAWGVSSKSQFQAAVSGLNPIDGPPSAWDGASVLQLWGTADDTVPATHNGQAMRAMYSTHPAYDPAPVVGQARDHSSTNGMYSFVDEMTSFLKVVTGSVPEDPQPKNFYRAIARYVIIDGLRHAVSAKV